MPRTLIDRAAWALVGALSLLLIATLGGVVRGGPLDPPSSPNSTLPQVEPRIPIRQPASAAGFPIVISQPGSYFVTQDITGVAAKNGIEVQVSNVTIDLNGFTLRGVPSSGVGLLFSDVDVQWCRPCYNVSVKNGTVADWGGDGINADFGDNALFEDLRVRNNGGSGIRAGGPSIISNVVASDNVQHGILLNRKTYPFPPVAGRGAGIVRDSSTRGNTLDGIQVLTNVFVINNDSFNNGGDGIHATFEGGSRIDSNNVGVNGGKAIHVDSTNNVIIRNTIRGAASDISITANNAAGPVETAGTPLSNPWANITY